ARSRAPVGAVERSLSSVLLLDLADNVDPGAAPAHRRVPEDDQLPEADLPDRHHPFLGAAETLCRERSWDADLDAVLQAGQTVDASWDHPDLRASDAGRSAGHGPRPADALEPAPGLEHQQRAPDAAAPEPDKQDEGPFAA